MKIKDWYSELQEQNTRLNTVQLGLVRESIHLDGNSVTVTIGRKAEIEFIPHGYTHNCGISLGEPASRLGTTFSSLFRKHQDSFVGILEKIRQQVDEVVNAVTELFAAIVDQDIPELMLEKISGEQMGNTPQDLVKKTTEIRFKKLSSRLQELPKPFENVSWKKTVAKKELVIYRGGDDWRLSWDKIDVGQTILPLTQCLLFLANYEKIAKAVEKFATAVEASAKILAD